MNDEIHESKHINNYIAIALCIVNLILLLVASSISQKNFNKQYSAISHEVKITKVIASDIESKMMVVSSNVGELQQAIKEIKVRLDKHSERNANADNQIAKIDASLTALDTQKNQLIENNKLVNEEVQKLKERLVKVESNIENIIKIIEENDSPNGE